MAIVSWAEIFSFADVKEFFEVVRPLGAHVVKYRAKVKFKGTCVSVQKRADGTLECQSRTATLTPDHDVAGFARWVEAHKDAWSQRLAPGQVVFGEWCGSSVTTPAEALTSAIPHNIFAVFAALDTLHPAGVRLIVEPDALTLKVPPGVGYVMPWQEGSEITVDWLADPEILEPTVARIGALVAAVETRDSWVHSIFGVAGAGLVFYPQGQTALDAFAFRVFKATSNHSAKVTAAVQMNPGVAAKPETSAGSVRS